MWLSSTGISIPKNSSKAELYELVKLNKNKVLFVCIKIAEKYSYNLFYILPYHYELQSIEGIWLTVKDEVARTSPYSNLLAIRNKLLQTFREKVTSK
ncbi:9047_t:CDS:1, partial [Scutellospora calospora]